MTVATMAIPVDTGLIEEDGRALFAQGEEASVFTILELSKRLAEHKATEDASSHQTPSAPSGINPPHSLVVVFHAAQCDLLHDRPIAGLADFDEILCPGFRRRLGDRFVGSPQRSRMRVSPDVLGTSAARPGTYGKIQVAGQELGPHLPKKLRRLLGDAIRLWRRQEELSPETYASRRQRLPVRLQALIDEDWSNAHAKRLMKRLCRHQNDLFTLRLHGNR